MYKYQASNPTTGQASERTFMNLDEANDFAEENIQKYPDFRITSLGIIIDGVLDEGSTSENKEIDEEYDEEMELDRMGLGPDENGDYPEPDDRIDDDVD